MRNDAPPGVISAKYARPVNEQTVEIYKRAAEAEREKRPEKVMAAVKEIIAVDPQDFVALAKLGSLYAELNKPVEAEAALRKALTVRKDYVPAMLNIGLLKAFQGQYPAAVETFEHAVAADPTNARSYRLLGEAYFQVKRGTDGLAALDEALRIDPQGMAECHLLKARLYDLAGAKNLALAEYKAFLEKTPGHPDKKKFEKYIKENSP
jgi:superkiller protein 3